MKKILDYEEMLSVLEKLKRENIKECEPIGTSTFGEPIKHFTYGTGDEHIIFTAGTHSSELITNIFLINFMIQINNNEINIDNKKYTLHFIPILNPDGTIIVTSAIRKLIPKETNEFYEQLICLQYYLNSRLDDNNVINNKDKEDKIIHLMFKYFDIDCINDKHQNLKDYLKNLLKSKNIPLGSIINWSSNGRGIDLNSNINVGEYFKEFNEKDEKHFSNRLNQINRFEPGVVGCPSISKEFIEEKENQAIFNFYNDLISKHKVIGSFIFHSNGGEVHYLDKMEEKNYWNEKHGNREIFYNRNVATVYSNTTDYKLYSPKTYTTFCSKLRTILPGSLVIELSHLRSNPLSQFIDLDFSNYVSEDIKGELKHLSKEFSKTIYLNSKAICKTIETMSREYYKYKYSICVNKNNKYIDNNDYKLILNCSKYKDGRNVEEDTYKNWLEFKEYAKKNNFDIEIESAYRSEKYQNNLYEKFRKLKGKDYADKYVAKPGFSEHNTGLAIDVCLLKDDKYIFDENLYNTGLNEFIENNCYLFGFIVRYPKDKEKITNYNYEPWHIRYVGKELSKYLYENNITLEEYFEE